jgi:hypothetical protein
MKQHLLQPVNTNSDIDGRRGFLKKTALGGLSLAGSFFLPVEDTIAQTTSGVNRFSSPSNLKITDLRYTTVMHFGRPIL